MTQASLSDEETRTAVQEFVMSIPEEDYERTARLVVAEVSGHSAGTTDWLLPHDGGEDVVCAVIGALWPHIAAYRGRGLSGTAIQLRSKEWLDAAYSSRSASAIAAELGCNPKTVLTWLRRHGIKTRAPSQATPTAATDADARKDAFVLALRQWSDAHDGAVPTQAAWDMSRPTGTPTHKTGRDMFGSWSAALEAAGLTPRKYGYQDPMTMQQRRKEARKALVDALRAWSLEHDGESPSLAEWDATRPLDAPSDRVARKVFGSWNAALRAAGLQVRQSGERKHRDEPMPAGRSPDASRQMVTGKGLDDRLLGTVKHFGT